MGKKFLPDRDARHVGLPELNADGALRLRGETCGVDLIQSQGGDARPQGQFGAVATGVVDLERRRLIGGGRELQRRKLIEPRVAI